MSNKLMSIILNATILLTICGVYQARLIQIYRKSATNSAGSSSNDSLALSAPSEGARQNTDSIEFTSPMKRILELITNHKPMIVVTDSETYQQETTTPSLPSQQNIDQQIKHSQAESNNEQQQWTVVDPANGVIQPIFESSQHQQITGFPLSQFFVAAQSGQPYMMSPALGQYVVGMPQQFAASRQMQQLNGEVESAQPIFLSSYVPEMISQFQHQQQTLQQQLPPPKGNFDTQTNSQNSIQQIQKTQNELATKKNDAKEAADSSLTSNKNDLNDDSVSKNSKDSDYDDVKSDGDDSQDTSTSKKMQSQDNPEEDPKDNHSNGGTITYEDKYDSDNPKESKSPKNVMIQETPLQNGLVSVGLNDDCLQCICRASSGCDHQLRCITRGTDEKRCGPFQLTEDYWTKAGSPGDDASNFIAFETCSTDMDCAVEAVTNYIKRYKKDCDGDGSATCMDFARLHRLKPDECEDTEKLVNDPESYWEKFQRCAETYNRSRSFEDEDTFRK